MQQQQNTMPVYRQRNIVVSLISYSILDPLCIFHGIVNNDEKEKLQILKREWRRKNCLLTRDMLKRIKMMSYLLSCMVLEVVDDGSQVS